MPKSKMTQKEANQTTNFKFRTPFNRSDALEFSWLETRCEMEQGDFVMRGARRLLMRLQS